MLTYNVIWRGNLLISCVHSLYGGQHRSVYCAGHMAEYIARKYDVHVHLYHRELEIEKDL
jgi:RNase adaptor protein for sRNA GlmZ degradation